MLFTFTYSLGILLNVFAFIYVCMLIILHKAHLYFCLKTHTLQFGWRTTNFVESENSAALSKRKLAPFNFFLTAMEDHMTIQQQVEVQEMEGNEAPGYAFRSRKTGW